MYNVPAVKELHKICFKSKPDVYRRLSIYFTRCALIFGIRANTITILRAILLLVGIMLFSFAPITVLWMILGILAFQLVLFMDTMDGAIARYNKEASFFGEVLDFLLDHFSSSIIYFITAGILSYRLFGALILLWTSIAAAALAQIGVFLRMLYTEHNIDVDKLRNEQFIFAFFHQDNMRLLLLALTVAIIWHFFDAHALPILIIAYLQFIIIKILFLGGFLWVYAGKFPVTKHIFFAYVLSILWFLFRFRTAHLELMHYKDTKIVQAILKNFQK